MVRCLILVTVMVVLAPLVASAQSIEGVWRMVEREFQGGTNPRVESGAQIQPSLLIYTDGYFMWTIIGGTEPRPVLTGTPPVSDEEIGRVARFYNSSAGTYELDGSTLRYNRMVATIPNAMLPENQPLEREVVTPTSNRLETSATNANGVTTILKYTRVE